MEQKMNDSLTDRIRKKVEEAAKEQTDEFVSLLPRKQIPEPDPDTDRKHFSAERRSYESSLDIINDSPGTAAEFTDIGKLDQVLQSLNRTLETLAGKPEQGLLGKIMTKLVSYGIRPELDTIKQALSETTQSLNILNHKIRIFAGKQESFNSEVAVFGQKIVPVIDEKIRYNLQKHAKYLKDRMDVFHENTDKRQNEISNWLHNLLKRLDILDSDLKRGLALQHRKLEHLLQNRQETRQGTSVPIGETRQYEDPGLGDYGYYLFETQGRGPEEFVKANQRDYLPFFKDVSPVLDIGCGRGEFLELLREAGIRAMGVDTNSDMVEICRQKELDVICRDAMDALAQYASEQLGGIFAGQVVEHFTPNKVLPWLLAAYQALKPGGILVYETINTASLYALVTHYFKDPTHHLPRHPDTYTYLTGIAGFKNVVLQYRSPVPREIQLSAPVPQESCSDEMTIMYSGIQNVIDQLNSLIYGPCDIVICARKPGD
jgi:SAM-dependent methyltransferase